MGKKERNIMKAFAMVTQIGITVMAPLLLCGAAGWWLDEKFHTQLWFVVWILLGIGAAFRNVYMLTRPFYAKDMEREHAQLEYIAQLKRQGEAKRQQDGCVESEDARREKTQKIQQQDGQEKEMRKSGTKHRAKA